MSGLIYIQTVWHFDSTHENFFGKNNLNEEESILMCLCFVWFESLRPSQQFFSYVGTGLPRLNPYLARINVSYSRTQCSIAGEIKPATPVSQVKPSTTEPLGIKGHTESFQSILSIHNKASIYITGRTSEQWNIGFTDLHFSIYYQGLDNSNGWRHIWYPLSICLKMKGEENYLKILLCFICVSAHNHRDQSCYNIFSSSSISSSQPQGPIMLQYLLVQLDLQLTTTGTDHVTISSRPARSPAHNHRDRSCYNIVSSSSISSSQPQGPIMLQYLLVQLDLQLTTTGTDHVTISSRPARSLCLALHLQNKKVHI